MTSTIVTQIEDIEKKIASYEDRLDSIDRSLRLREMPSQEREDLLEEEKQIKRDVQECQQQLKSLRSENRKTMLVSVVVLAVVYLVYSLFWSK
ncbi:coiled-coil domain-containing protein 167 [Exaiptasia diaphana]|uniref:Coiled-coil domain-containing protein 167 n=1 Tax=Exaiptasia diaphana TaxID=2652724 RepID=A0A913XNM8_EXADI|nr:coiled-coil domain-containing protein 167 [Exaiptasia diaphana]KXJ10221.1 Coiled-coil domain-containing protein 167 [Exaiptasia diaphana]